MNDIERHHTGARMSKIVRYGGMIFLCGQTASGSTSATAGIEAQTREVLSRVDALLQEAGGDRSRMLAAAIYLRRMEDFAAMNAIWESWVPGGSAPARTTVEASLAASNLLVEITVIAASAAGS